MIPGDSSTINNNKEFSVISYSVLRTNNVMHRSTVITLIETHKRIIRLVMIILNDGFE